MTGCKVNYVLKPRRMSKTGKGRSRVMRNLHSKKNHSRKRTRRRRGRPRKHKTRKRKSRRGRGRPRKHKTKRRRKRNLGRAPKLNGFIIRDIILGNNKPTQDILDHIPRMDRLHNLLQKMSGFNLSKRQQIYKRLIPKAVHSDDDTKELQEQAVEDIIRDLEGMGLKTPTPPQGQVQPAQSPPQLTQVELEEEVRRRDADEAKRLHDALEYVP